MNTVATLIVNRSDPLLAQEHLDSATAALDKTGATLKGEDWLAAGTAADLFFTGTPIDEARVVITAALAGKSVDLVVQAASTRRKTLLVADMDSTMIEIECIDELADFAGLKDKVAAITEAAMQGDLDFDDALRDRVALLKGMNESVLHQVYDTRLTYTPGAETLVKTMAANGSTTILVSGGFTFFTERVADALGFAVHRANQLGKEGGQLTGAVIPPIVNSATKLAVLKQYAEDMALEPHAVLAVGDGANDIPILEAAGLGVAYRAKAKAAAAADATLYHADLTAILYAQGYRDSDFVK